MRFFIVYSADTAENLHEVVNMRNPDKNQYISFRTSDVSGTMFARIDLRLKSRNGIITLSANVFSRSGFTLCA